MYFELKENKPHGTKDDPFSTYHIKNEGRSFQIPVHWHDELEIINSTLNNDNVFVISHRGDQLGDKFESHIRFEKVKNFSEISQHII